MESSINKNMLKDKECNNWHKGSTRFTCNSGQLQYKFQTVVNNLRGEEQAYPG